MEAKARILALQLARPLYDERRCKVGFFDVCQSVEADKTTPAKAAVAVKVSDTNRTPFGVETKERPVLIPKRSARRSLKLGRNDQIDSVSRRAGDGPLKPA